MGSFEKVYRFVKDKRQPFTIDDIATKHNINSGNVWKILHKLEKMDIVVGFEPNKNNPRGKRYYFYLTEEERKVIW